MTRKVGQQFRLNDDTIIRIVWVGQNSARVGIIAPDDVKIFREEVYQDIQRDLNNGLKKE